MKQLSVGFLIIFIAASNFLNAMPTAPSAPFNGIASVCDFGAKGDASDDTAPIQAAVDFLVDKGGGVLFFPTGNYVTSGIMIPDNKRISIEGVVPGVHFRENAAINDIANVSRLVHKDGVERPLIEYTKSAPDRHVSLYRGGHVHITNMLLVGGSKTKSVVRFRHVTRPFQLANLYINVSEKNAEGNGLELYESWFGMVDNIYLRHGAEGGKQGFASTGTGLKVWNDAAVREGNAINQLIINNLSTNWFGNGIIIGSEMDSSVRSQYINSVIFNGGAVQYSGNIGIWLGRGIESISFRGVHVEKSKRAGVYIGHGARNVAFRDAKLHDNSSYVDPSGSSLLSGKEISVGETEARNVILENILFSQVGQTGVFLGAAAADVRMDQLSFGPKKAGQGVAMRVEAPVSSNNRLGPNIRFDVHRGRDNQLLTFASDIIGGDDLWHQAGVGCETITRFGELKLSPRTANVLILEQTGAGIVRDIEPAYKGCRMTLIFKNENTTVVNTPEGSSHGIHLRGGKDFSGYSNAVLTLIYAGDGAWVEISRSK